MAQHDNRHALVTGGGTGIGAAIALALAGEGAKVTITGRRKEPLEEIASKSSNISIAVLDVTDADMVDAVFQDAASARGNIDILIANAGIAETLPIAKMDLDFWRRTMATNLDGAFLTMKAALPGMIENQWGRVIAIASIAGQRGMSRGSAYCASKHGMIGLCRALSAEMVNNGITVNALCPGYVRTPIVDRNVEKIMKRSGLSAEQALKAMTDSNPNGKLVEPEEIADAALWLCGPGSQSVSGQDIQIAGGHA